MSQPLVAIVVGCVISGVYYPGIALANGVDIELRPQPCQPPESGLQQAVVYQQTPSGEKLIFTKFNVSAISDVFFPETQDDVPHEFAILEPQEIEAAEAEESEG